MKEVGRNELLERIHRNDVEYDDILEEEVWLKAFEEEISLSYEVKT